MSAKPKQPRKELTSLRLEPHVKYLAEIAAREQRRTLTNYIEWVLEKSFEKVIIELSTGVTDELANVGSDLWDVYESVRFIKLAILKPDLLSYDEQLLWKSIYRYDWLLIDKSLGWQIDNIKQPLAEAMWPYLSVQQPTSLQVSKEQLEALKILGEMGELFEFARKNNLPEDDILFLQERYSTKAVD